MPAPNHAADALAVAICHALDAAADEDVRVIARLRGRIAGRAGQGLVVDVNGVGYLVSATPSVQRLGDGEITIEIHTVVREDTLALYGFATARGARALRAPARRLRRRAEGRARDRLRLDARPSCAARSRATTSKRFEAIPGIGLKTAQRVVLELKEKLASVD